MRNTLMAGLAAATITFAAAPAAAQVVATATPGCAVYCGPTPVTYDFETAATTPTYVGGAIVGPGTTTDLFAQPLGSTGFYFSTGPSTITPSNITLGDNILSFSFIWGSLDLYNTLTLNTLGGSQAFTGADIAALIPGGASGSHTDPSQNPIVTFTLSGLWQQAVNFDMSSTQNAFELDNIFVQPVPEPGTWAMMLLGFGGIGYAMRRRRKPLLQIA